MSGADGAAKLSKGQSERLHHRAPDFARKDEGGASRAPPEIPQPRFPVRGTADRVKDSRGAQVRREAEFRAKSGALRPTPVPALVPFSPYLIRAAEAPDEARKGTNQFCTVREDKIDARQR